MSGCRHVREWWMWRCSQAQTDSVLQHPPALPRRATPGPEVYEVVLSPQCTWIWKTPGDGSLQGARKEGEGLALMDEMGNKVQV